MCNDNFFHGGVVFPNFTRYACCNPCCDGSVSAQRVESVNDDCDNDRCNCCRCCCHCCNCCHHHCCNNDEVSGTSNESPCPCRGGW